MIYECLPKDDETKDYRCYYSYPKESKAGVRMCKSNYYCDTSKIPEENEAFCKFVKDGLLPGIYADSDEKCATKKRDELNLCIGYERDQDCETDSQCKEGLYCSINENSNTGKCAILKKEDEECTRTEECEIGCYCYLNTQKSNSKFKTCTKLFSLKNGAEVRKEDQNLCESGMVGVPPNSNSDITVCVSREILSTDNVCKTLDDKCEYNTDFGYGYVKEELECQHSATNRDKFYCPASTETDTYKNALKDYKNLMANSYYRRHTVRKNSTTYSVYKEMRVAREYPFFKM
jgi:hypothetical protein